MSKSVHYGFTITDPQEAEYSKKDNELHVWGRDVADGHHAMSELYEHRHRLFLALVKVYDNYVTPLNCHVKCWKSKFHDDGSFYDGWFLLGMSVEKPQFRADSKPETYEISYHVPDKYWHLAHVIELERAPKYDGYTSFDVLERLTRL